MNFAKLIDISVPLSEKLPVWPGGHGFKKTQLQTISENADANVSGIDYDVHCGTHIDAPLHFIPGGGYINQIALDVFFGECMVISFPHISVITRKDLESKEMVNGTRRVLFKTANSDREWYTAPFDRNFVAISNDAAEYLVEAGIFLVGIDGPSIQKFQDPKDTHITLLQSNIAILEGLNLADVEEGVYDIVCPPVSIEGSEAMSARAILITK